MLENFVPYESTVTQLLAEAGAVMVGKTNLDEFAMGSSTENSAQVTNPWDVSRCRGLFGGSAAAVRRMQQLLSVLAARSVNLPLFAVWWE